MQYKVSECDNPRWENGTVILGPESPDICNKKAITISFGGGGIYLGDNKGQFAHKMHQSVKSPIVRME